MPTSTEQVTYSLLRRKPTAWKVYHADKVGIVKKTGDTANSKRWRLYSSEGVGGRFFRSRREAFCFFRTGEAFTTNPVYSKHGRAKGARIR